MAYVADGLSYVSKTNSDDWFELSCADEIRFADVKMFAFYLGERGCTVYDRNKTKPLTTTRYDNEEARYRVNPIKYDSAYVICKTRASTYRFEASAECELADDLAESGIYYPAIVKTIYLRFANSKQMLRSMSVVSIVDFDPKYLKESDRHFVISLMLASLSILAGCVVGVFVARSLLRRLRFGFLVYGFVSLVFLIATLTNAFLTLLLFNMHWWPKTQNQLIVVYCVIVGLVFPFQSCITGPVLYMLFEIFECVLILCGARPNVHQEEYDHDVTETPLSDEEESETSSYHKYDMSELSDSDDDKPNVFE